MLLHLEPVENLKESQRIFKNLHVKIRVLQDSLKYWGILKDS